MPSKLKVIHVSFAGNSSLDVAAPVDGHKYRLLSLILTLTCDATVANRYFNINHYVSGTSDKLMPTVISPAAVIASATSVIYMTPFGVPPSGTASSLTTGNGVSIPGPLLIDSETTFNVTVASGVAGDTVTGHILVEDIAP